MEMDLSKPKLNEVNIKLYIGVITVTFDYEHEFKVCGYFKKPGHAKESCFAFKNKSLDAKNVKGGLGRSMSQGRNKRKSRSRVLIKKTWKLQKVDVEVDRKLIMMKC